MEDIKILLETGEETDVETLEQGLNAETVIENPEIELYWDTIPENPENPFIIGLDIEDLADFASTYNGEHHWQQIASTQLNQNTLALLNHEINQMAERELEKERHKYSDFTTRTVMHDTKNILQTLEGYIELYQETGDEKHFQTVLNASKNIQTLYEELEALQKLYEEDHKTHINAYDILQEINSKLEFREDQKSKSIHLPENNTHYTFHSSPLIERMMYNLLDNSLEHGQTDPEIDMYKENGHINIDVYDNGEIPQSIWDNWGSEHNGIEDYPGTGTFLIGEIAQRNNIRIEPLENGYRVKIPET